MTLRGSIALLRLDGFSTLSDSASHSLSRCQRLGWLFEVHGLGLWPDPGVRHAEGQLQDDLLRLRVSTCRFCHDAAEKEEGFLYMIFRHMPTPFTRGIAGVRCSPVSQV